MAFAPFFYHHYRPWHHCSDPNCESCERRRFEQKLFNDPQTRKWAIKKLEEQLNGYEPSFWDKYGFGGDKRYDTWFVLDLLRQADREDV